MKTETPFRDVFEKNFILAVRMITLTHKIPSLPPAGGLAATGSKKVLIKAYGAAFSPCLCRRSQMGLTSTWRYGKGPGTGTEKMVRWDSCCFMCLVMITMAGFSLARPSYNLVGKDTSLEPEGE